MAYHITTVAAYLAVRITAIVVVRQFCLSLCLSCSSKRSQVPSRYPGFPLLVAYCLREIGNCVGATGDKLVYQLSVDEGNAAKETLADVSSFRPSSERFTNSCQLSPDSAALNALSSYLLWVGASPRFELHASPARPAAGRVRSRPAAPSAVNTGLAVIHALPTNTPLTRNEKCAAQTAHMQWATQKLSRGVRWGGERVWWGGVITRGGRQVTGSLCYTVHHFYYNAKQVAPG